MPALYAISFSCVYTSVATTMVLPIVDMLLIILIDNKPYSLYKSVYITFAGLPFE